MGTKPSKMNHNDPVMEDHDLENINHNEEGNRGAPHNTELVHQEILDEGFLQTAAEEARLNQALDNIISTAAANGQPLDFEAAARAGYGQVPAEVSNYGSPINPRSHFEARGSNRANEYATPEQMVEMNRLNAEREAKTKSDREAAETAEKARQRKINKRNDIATAILGSIQWAVIIGGAVVGILAATGNLSNNPPTVLDDPKLKANDDAPDMTYAFTQTAIVRVLDNDTGYDPKTVKIVDFDTGSAGKKKTVAEGVWAVEDDKDNPGTNVITFTPIKGATSGPAPIKYSVNGPDGTTSNEATVTLKYKAQSTPIVPVDVKINDLNQRVHDGRDFTLDGLGTLASDKGLDIKTIRLVNAAKDNVTTLTVAGEGKWNVDSAGNVSFAADSTFKSIPSAIHLTIADSKGKRTPEFKVELKPFSRPFTVNIYDYENLPSIDFSSASRAAGVLTRTVRPLNLADMPAANAGQFPIDKTSLTLMGPAPLDGGMPSYRRSSDGKKLTVPGEGVWTVSEDKDSSGKVINASVTFVSAADFVRWPSPVIYYVKDVEGYQSARPAIIWIHPDLGTVATKIDQLAVMDDDTFWGLYAKTILTAPAGKKTDLDDVLIATNMLWRMTLNSISMELRDIIDLKPRYTEALYNKQLMLWGMTHNEAFPNLAADSAVITDAVTGLKDIPLGTRLIRLTFIRRLVTDAING